METTAGGPSDSAFDPSLAPALLFEAGREQSLEGLMELLKNAPLTRDQLLARTEIRLIEEGGICVDQPHWRSHCQRVGQDPRLPGGQAGGGGSSTWRDV
jgi:hypothetical protein